MSSVDERVVKMQFDNAQFEKGVAQSMNSIKNLEVSLGEIGKTSDSFGKIQNAVNGLKLDKIGDSADVVSKRMSTMGIAGATVISNLTSSVMSFVGSGLRSLTSGITQTMDTIVEGGMSRAAKIEQARFMINGLAKDSGETFKQLDEAISYAVNDTAYGYDSAAMASAQFYASNIRDVESQKTALRGISGVAAMASADYDSVAQIFTKVAGNGRIMGEELLQLSSYGINAAATIRDYMAQTSDFANITEADVRDMVSKGQIDFNTFANAMDWAFGEHAKEANYTFTGVSQNVQAALKKIGAEFQAVTISSENYKNTLTDGQADFTKNTFNQINTLNELKNILNTLKKEIVDLGFVDLFTEIYQSFHKGLSFFLRGFYEINDGTKRLIEPLQNALKNIKQAIENVSGFVIGIANSVSVAWHSVFPESLPEIIEKITGAIADITSILPRVTDFSSAIEEMFGLDPANYSSNVKDASEETAEACETIEEAYNGVTGSLQELTRQVIRGDFGNGQDRIDALGDSYQQIQDAVNSCYDAQGRLHEDWIDNIDSTITVGNQAAETIQEVSQAEIEAARIEQQAADATDLFAQKYDELANIIPGVLPPANRAAAAFDGLRTVMRGLFSALNIVKKVVSGIVEIAKRFVVPVVLKIGEVLGSVVAMVFSWITALDGALDSGGAFANILDVISKALSPLWWLFEEAANGAIAFFNALTWKGSGNPLSSFADMIANIELPGGTKLADAAHAIFDPVLDFFKPLRDKLEKYIRPVSDFMHEMGESFDNAWNMDASPIEKLAAAFAPLTRRLEPILDSIKKFFSPLISYLAPVGEALKGLLTAIANRVSEAFQRLREDFQNGDSIFDKARRFFEPFIEFLKPIATKLGNWLGKIAEKFTEFVNDMAKSVSESEGLLNPINEFLKGLWESLKGFFSSDNLANIGTTAGGIFETLGTTLSDKATGFREKVSEILDTLKTFLSEKFGELYDKLFGVDAGVDKAYGLTETGDALESTAEDYASPIDIIISGLKNLAEGLKEYAPVIYGGAMTLAAAYAIFKFGTIEREVANFIKSASKSLTSVTGIFSAVQGLIGQVTKTLQGVGRAVAFRQYAAGLLEVAGAIAILAGAVWVLSTIDTESLKRAGIALGLIAAGIVAIVGVLRVFSKVNLKEAGLGLIEIAIGAIVLVGAVKRLSSIDWAVVGDGLLKLLAIVGSVMLVLAVAARVAKNGFATFKSVGLGLVGLAAGFYILTKALQQLKSVVESSSAEELEAMLTVVFHLLGYMTIFTALLSYLKADSLKSGGLAIMELSVALYVLSMALGKIASIDTGRLEDSLTAIESLMVFLAGFMAVIGYFGPNISKAVPAIFAMVLALGVLVGAVWLFAEMLNSNSDTLWSSIEAIALLIGVFGALFVAVGTVGPQIDGVTPAILSLALVVAVLAGACYLLAQVGDQLMPAVLALAGLMIVFAGVLIALGSAATGAVPGFLAVAVVFVAIGIAAALTGLGLLLAAAAFYVVISALQESLPLLNRLAAMADNGVFDSLAQGILRFVSVLTPMAGLLIVVGIGVALLGGGLLMLALASNMINVEAMGQIVNVLQTIADHSDMAGNLALIGVAAIVLAVGLALVGVALIVVAAGFLALAIAVIVAGLALMVFAGGIALISMALNFMAQQLTDDIVNQLVRSLNALGTVDAGALLILGAALVVLGLGLVLIAAGVLIIEACGGMMGLTMSLMMLSSSVDAGAIAAIGAAMIVLGVALIICGVGLVVFGAGTLIAAAGIFVLVAALSYGLAFIQSLAGGFAEAGANIVQGLIGGIQNAIGGAISAIGNLASGIVNGFCSLLGIHSPSALFEQLAGFIVQGLTGGITNGLGQAQESGQQLGQATYDGAESTTDQFTEAGQEAGDNYAQGVENADTASAGENAGNETANALLAKVGEYTGIGGEGGSNFAQGFTNEAGEIDVQSMVGKFTSGGQDAGQAFGLGTGEGIASTDLSQYTGQLSQSAGQASEEDMRASGEAAGKAYKEGFESTSDSLNEAGRHVVQTLGTTMAEAPEIQDASNQLMASFGQGLVDNAMQVTPGASAMASAAATEISSHTEEFSTAGSAAAGSFGQGLSSSNVSWAGSQVAWTAVNGALATSMSMVIPGTTGGLMFAMGLMLMQGAARNAGGSLAGNAHAGAATLNLIGVGMKGGLGFANGVRTMGFAARSAGSSLASNARGGAGSVSMSGVGRDVAQGFVNGINSKRSAAYQAGWNLGRAAKQGEQDATRTASPSREFMQLGRWNGEGLVIGMTQMEGAVYNAGYSMGDTALDAMSESISAISDIITADLDAQPTITPVLDTSDMETGLAAMNSLLNSSYQLKSAGDYTAALGLQALAVDSARRMSTTNASTVINNWDVDVDARGNTSGEDVGNDFVQTVRRVVRTS